MAVVSNQTGRALTAELRDKVFQNELIQDKIFDYVFSPGSNGAKQASKNVVACRLVEHAWLEFVSRRLRKSNFLNIKFDFSPWSFQNFLDTWTTVPGAESRIPLFNMHFSPWYYVERGQLFDFVMCLMRFGSKLYSLRLEMDRFIPTDSDASFMDLQVDMSHMHLPNLVNINVVMRTEDNDSVITLLLPPILASCENLISLGIAADRQVPLKRMLSQVGQLNGELEYLPITLEKVEINVNVTPELLANLFVENSLPNLSDLTIDTWEGGYSDVISRIVNRFSQQLKHFTLRGLFNIGLDPPDTSLSLVTLNFPIMSKLKGMNIYSFHCEPELDMEQSFPLLEKLNVQGQTTSTMLNWTRHSHFDCVKELNVQFVKGYSNDRDLDFTLELSQQLIRSFPNVAKLDIEFGNLVENGSVQTIFQHMSKLCELKFRLNNTSQINGPSTWDAILLGVDPQYAKNLAKSSAELHCNIVRLNRVRPLSHSIVNLKNLTAFSLTTADRMAHWNDNLISDIAFRFAFLCMPNLQMLTLMGQFRASVKMARKWRRQGRQILEDRRRSSRVDRYNLVHEDDLEDFDLGITW